LKTAKAIVDALFGNGKGQKSVEKEKLVFLFCSTEDIVSYPTANYVGITFSREGFSTSTSPDIVSTVSDSV